MVNFRKCIDRFYQLEDKDWELFSTIWQPIKIGKGEILTRKGEVEKYMYFVKAGVLRGFYANDKTDFTGGFSYEGDLSGIPDSFLNQVPSLFYLETLTQCNVLRTSFQQIQKLYQSSIIFERMGRIIAEKMLLGLNTRHVELQCYTAEERFKVFMNRSPHLLQKIPQKYLASYLSMAPETFSRLIRNVKL
jgi:CRP-like cAMP-binding protein